MKKSNTNGILREEAGALNASMAVLDQLGVSRDHAERLRIDSDYAARVAKAMKYGKGGSIYWQTAQKIMCENFFGPEDWRFFFGVHLTKEQLLSISEFPWNEKVLYGRDPLNPKERIKNTHLAWLGLKEMSGRPLTLYAWDGLKCGPAIHQERVSLRFWGDEEDADKRDFDMKFAETSTCELGWYLMPVEYAGKMMKKTWAGQASTVPKGYRIGTAIEEVTKGVLYAVKHKNMHGSVHLDHSNKEKFVRCAEKQPRESHVAIGCYPYYTVVGNQKDEEAPANVGLSIARM